MIKSNKIVGTFYIYFNISFFISNECHINLELYTFRTYIESLQKLTEYINK